VLVAVQLFSVTQFAALKIRYPSILQPVHDFPAYDGAQEKS
jgi:hypothetical protein